MDSVGEGKGGEIWENNTETCRISCMKCTTEQLTLSFILVSVCISLVVKNLPANRRHKRPEKIYWRREWLPTPVFSPGKIPRTEELGGLQSLVSQRVRHD